MVNILTKALEALEALYVKISNLCLSLCDKNRLEYKSLYF